MKSTDDQGLIPVIVASEADSTYIRTIPTVQPATGDGSVSLDLGLPPECATSVAAGGKRPEMKDMNGIWNLFSRAIQSLQAYRGVYSASFAMAIGGYPKYALVSDSSGNFWVSTADDNTTVPGADDATWQSLFNGYATQAWANGQFLQLALATLQTVTGPVAFGSKTTVPSVTAFTGTDALNAETAEGRYVRSVPATGGTNARIVDVQEDAAGNLIATKSDGTTSSYAPSSYGTFTDGYWIQTGNIRQIWWSQKIHSNDTVPFPLAFASAPEVFPVQTEYQDQLPQFAMGFACINDAQTTATSCVILSLVVQDSSGTFFPAPSGGVVVKFYAVGPVS